MRQLEQTILPRKYDLQFLWVARDLGPQWQTWRGYASEWMTTQHVGLGHRLWAFRAFFEAYLHALKMPAEPAWLLTRKHKVADFFATACPKSEEGAKYNNCISTFLDWVLERHFSELNDRGQRVVSPGYHNPVPRRSLGRLPRPTESVHSPLPYRFIRELSDILAPGEHFRDWVWAQGALGAAHRTHGGWNADWFEVSQDRINHNDPDCVWRRRKAKKGHVTELWFPGRTAALLVKLTLPLRTYQVRMLDSGESDTWRYTGNGWLINTDPLAPAVQQRRPVQRGVFRRIEDRETQTILTGLYVNTNKTADLYKEKEELGYVIPWQHDKLLYWLEKLRNWQEKYNPIQRSTAWTELEIKHLNHAKSAKQLASMPDSCFLFRDATLSGDNRAKPLASDAIQSLWYKLLTELERRCAARGESRPGGKPLKFMHSDRDRVSLFPLHSLRVSLLTCMALDAEVPLVVLSKLVAGHSRIVMTLYYTKPGIGRMTRLLNEASEKLDSTASVGMQRFLAEASYDEIAGQSVFNSLEGIKIALPPSATERNPAGWMARHHGLCLVGGNTSPSEGNSRIGGCYNGGPAVRKETATKSFYGAVPGGPRNCVRCRWFVTEPHYVDALRAHFNNVSYQLAEMAKEAKAYEDRLETLKKKRYAAEQAMTTFTEQAEYIRLERLWESCLTKVDQFANDLTATYRLIRRCMAIIDQDMQSAGRTQQLVAVGGLHDLRMAFEDTQSELLQLAGVCLDTEIYPDEFPGKAVVRRSQFLDGALYREGVQPVFLALSEDAQLHLGNRFMRHLAAAAKPGDHVSGLRKVVDILEAGRSLKEIGILSEMVEMLETELRRPLTRVSDLTQKPCRPHVLEKAP